MKDALQDPSRIKIVLSSKYKKSYARKTFLRYFNPLINCTKKEYKDTSYNPKFDTKKIIFHTITENDYNYIKIIYFIDKQIGETEEQLNINMGYFNYIKYILDETHEDSLYYYLTHYGKNKEEIIINSLSCDFEVVLKSKIKFTIELKLNLYSFTNLEEIIKTVYEYMGKIKKIVLDSNENKERAEELSKILNQNFIFQEDIHSSLNNIEFLKNLFIRNKKEYFLRKKWIPLGNSNKEMEYYFNQMEINKSVIIIGIKEKTFQENYNTFKNSKLKNIFQDFKSTRYNAINYTIHELNIAIDLNKEIKLKYHKNEYISNYTEPIEYESENIEMEYFNDSKIERFINNFEYINLLVDKSYKLPKVYLKTFFFHPFLRSSNFANIGNNLTVKDRQFFDLILFLQYVKKELFFDLSDAVRAGNNFQFYFNNYYSFCI